MSAQLVVRDLSAAHGPRTLFQGLDLVVARGDVIGLVGPNGAGKTTLLRQLAGSDPPASGTRQLSPADATVGLLPQETDRLAGETLLGFLARRTGVAAAQQALDDATTALAAGDDGSDEHYGSALERWLSLGAADLDDRAPATLASVGLDVALDHHMTALSGGQAARAGLASLLLSRFDVLLLDEPTNDLDLAGLDQLERFVQQSQAGVVVVSHDREFLARTVTSILELDLHQRSVHHYGGGYDAYLVERERDRQHARARYEEYAGTVDSLAERARTQRAWADKGVRAARRRPADNDKFVKNWAVASSEKQAAKARQTDRMLERLEEVEEPRKEWQLQMSIAGAPPSGRVVATLSHAVAERGAFTLGPVTLQVDRGDRVAITGVNGSGKTTLLAVLLGELEPTSGVASLGAGVRVGRIDQARAAFVGEEPLLERFAQELPDTASSELRTLLAKFGLGGEHVLRPAGTLSPGERTRAALALLQARGVNLLVLDEPTNHLDLPAIEQLESALDLFDGTLLLVTHDRQLLARVHTTRRFVVDAGAVTEVDAN
ncbi:MAG: ABC-F family ATP-binding cassette domain-containing protein [Microthrixaceae bacterium]